MLPFLNFVCNRTKTWPTFISLTGILLLIYVHSMEQFIRVHISVMNKLINLNKETLLYISITIHITKF
jgi:hypothetical protein